MKAIVTCATGLVGYHVVNLLLKDKEFTKILALGRNKERLAELNELGAIAHNFDLTSEEEQRNCFGYTNLQPLWAVDNWKKGSKILDS